MTKLLHLLRAAVALAGDVLAFITLLLALGLLAGGALFLLLQQ